MFREWSGPDCGPEFVCYPGPGPAFNANGPWAEPPAWRHGRRMARHHHRRPRCGFAPQGARGDIPWADDPRRTEDEINVLRAQAAYLENCLADVNERLAELNQRSEEGSTQDAEG